MKRPSVVMVQCSACSGLGEVPSGTTGAIMRLEREGRGLTRNAIVPYFLKPGGSEAYSESYLIDLEHDSRAWSSEMVRSFRQAIEDCVKARLEEKVDV